MDVRKMIEELRQERAQIEEAIISLERLARVRAPRPDGPPAWMTAGVDVPDKRKGFAKRGRPPGRKNKPKNEIAESST
jgi:hypothetical protein